MYEQGKLVDKKIVSNWKLHAYLERLIDEGYQQAYDVRKYEKAVQKAKEMCFCFEDHMMDGCINGIAEIFDGDFACTGRGCYTQAWSVGEVLRAYCEDVIPYL